MEKPIEIPSTDTAPAVVTLMRYLLVALGGWLISRGWMEQEQLDTLVPIVLVAVPTIVGVWKTITKNREGRTMASLLHDSIAKEK